MIKTTFDVIYKVVFMFLLWLCLGQLHLVQQKLHTLNQILYQANFVQMSTQKAGDWELVADNTYKF